MNYLQRPCRRRILISLLPLLLLSAGVHRAGAEQPNFVVIMADDLGYGDLSCYDGWIATPHLDELSREGMRFTDFHSSGNVCSPTRAGLMTGRYQQRAGIPGVIIADPARPVHYHGLQHPEITFAEVLRETGYATAIYGKWHLGYETHYNPVHQGFDEFCGYVSGNVDFFSHIDQAGNYDWWHQDQRVVEEGYTTHLITRHAVDFIERHHDRPFCLYLPHEAPHYPYQGPNDSAERTVGGNFGNTGKRDDVKEAYSEMVQAMDEGVGEVLATLDRFGLQEKTLVLFFSDNGATPRGSNGLLRGAKGSNWEGGHRVPCIARWPGVIAPGTVCEDLTITLDVMPTLIEAAGAELPAGRALDGSSMMSRFAGERASEERKLVWNGKALREGNWKLIVDGKGGDRVGLYDLSADLGEQRNLASQHPDRVGRMREDLQRWSRDVAEGESVQPAERAIRSGRDRDQ